MHRQFLFRTAIAALIGTVACPSTAGIFDDPPQATPGLNAAELAYLRGRVDRDGGSREASRRASDALGLTTASAAPLRPNGLVLVNRSHGDYYSFWTLADGRYLVSRREWTGGIEYWLLLSAHFDVERAIFEVPEGVEALDPDQAETERGRILAFLRSNVPASSR
jgi:hypothetical protein